MYSVHLFGLTLPSTRTHKIVVENSRHHCKVCYMYHRWRNSPESSLCFESQYHLQVMKNGALASFAVWTPPTLRVCSPDTQASALFQPCNGLFNLLQARHTAGCWVYENGLCGSLSPWTFCLSLLRVPVDARVLASLNTKCQSLIINAQPRWDSRSCRKARLWHILLV